MPGADLSRTEVKHIILQFVDGDAAPGKWGWDDFISTSLSDPTLDDVRRQCSATHDTYPAPGRWCSDEGLALMRRLAEAL